MKILFIKQTDEQKFRDLLDALKTVERETLTTQNIKDAAEMIRAALGTEVKTKVIYKSSKDGRIVSKEFALDNEDETYRTVVMIGKK